MYINITYKDKFRSGIYIIQNVYDVVPTSKFYIGSANNLYARFMNHKKDLSKNQHTNSKLQNFYNKYGEDSLQMNVLEYCRPEDLIKREQFYIDTLKPFFNIVPKAGNSLGYRHTKENKEKMSRLKKGRQTTSMLGKNHSKATKELIGTKAKERGIPTSCKEDIDAKINRQRKLSDEQIKFIKHLLRIGVRQMTIARDYDVSQRLVSRIKNKIGFYANY